MFAAVYLQQYKGSDMLIQTEKTDKEERFALKKQGWSTKMKTNGTFLNVGRHYVFLDFSCMWMIKGFSL